MWISTLSHVAGGEVLTMPRVVDRIVRSEQRHPIRAGAPQRPVLSHGRHNDAHILLLVRFLRVQLVVRACRPIHPAHPSSIHDARVDLTERRVKVVVKPGADADAGRPELDVANLLDCVVRVENVEANEVVELEALTLGQHCIVYFDVEVP